jgi:hypothetical protein
MAGLDDLTNLLHQFTGTNPAPTAYTRVTRTPVSWGPTQSGGAGEYKNGAITLDPSQLSKDDIAPGNPLSNTIRHESVHAMMPDDAVSRIQKYLQGSDQMETAQQGLHDIDPEAAGSPKATAQEAPAYAMMGRTLGLDPSVTRQYEGMMPADVRQKYERLQDPTLMHQLAVKYGASEPPEIFMRVVAERVKQTAAQLGISPHEALQRFAQGELPLAAISSK